jgi:hypothetical protein
MTKKKHRSLAATARKFFRALDEGKSGYARADVYMNRLLDAGLKPGDELVLNAAGERAVLEDLYANARKVFRAHGIGRFELKRVKA